MVAKWGHVARTCQRAISGAPRLRRGLAFWIVLDLSGASPRPQPQCSSGKAQSCSCSAGLGFGPPRFLACSTKQFGSGSEMHRWFTGGGVSAGRSRCVSLAEVGAGR